MKILNFKILDCKMAYENPGLVYQTCVARVCSARRMCVIFYRRLHMCLKSLIDMQAHVHAFFAHTATCTRSFFTCDNMHMYFINTRPLLYASTYQPSYVYIAIVYTYNNYFQLTTLTILSTLVNILYRH